MIVLQVGRGVRLARGHCLQGMRRWGSLQRSAVLPDKSAARYNSNKLND